MDTLRALKVFICVAQQASFAEAARQLDMSAASVSRAVATLEAELGVQLLMRTTRSVRLTQEGEDFLARCQAGITEIESAFEVARSGQAGPGGSLTVTAPVVFGRLHVLPLIVALREQYPELRVRLLLLDRVVSLVDEGVDIAVRIAQLPDSALHGVHIGEVRRVLSASPEYLALRGRPASLSDLREHDLIWIEDETGPQRGWGLDAAARTGRQARLSVNNVDAAVAAAVAGLGVVRALSYQISDHVAAGRLERLLTDEEMPALPVSLVFQSGRKQHPNVRAFIELARRHLQGALL